MHCISSFRKRIPCYALQIAGGVLRLIGCRAIAGAGGRWQPLSLCVAWGHGHQRHPPAARSWGACGWQRGGPYLDNSRCVLIVVTRAMHVLVVITMAIIALWPSSAQYSALCVCMLSLSVRHISNTWDDEHDMVSRVRLKLFLWMGQMDVVIHARLVV
jgi:hypothetical protein